MGDHPSQQQGEFWLAEMLRLAGFPTQVSAEIRDIFGEHTCWITLESAQWSQAQKLALLDDHGRVLDAIQYLASSALNAGKSESEQGNYTIDLDGYRTVRHSELEALAHNAIEAVRATEQPYEMPSLSSAERRQLHAYVKSISELETQSRGQEPDRRLIIMPAGSIPSESD